MSDAEISKLELARKSGIEEKEVRRMRDTGHGTKLPRIADEVENRGAFVGVMSNL